MAAKRLLETRALVQRLTAERDNTTNRPLTLSPIAGLEDSDEATVAMAQDRQVFIGRSLGVGEAERNAPLGSWGLAKRSACRRASSVAPGDARSDFLGCAPTFPGALVAAGRNRAASPGRGE